MALSFDPRAMLTPGGVIDGAGNAIAALAGVKAKYRTANAKDKANEMEAKRVGLDEKRVGLEEQRIQQQGEQMESLKALQAAQAGAQMPWPVKGALAAAKALMPGRSTANQRPLARWKYSYDPAGQPVSRQDPYSGAIEGYDRTTQLWKPIGQAAPQPSAAPAPGAGGAMIPNDDNAAARLEDLTGRAEAGTITKAELQELEALSGE